MHTNSKMFFKLKHKHHNSIGITLQQSCREKDSEVKTQKSFSYSQTSEVSDFVAQSPATCCTDSR